jgi:hypothetical protein
LVAVGLAVSLAGGLVVALAGWAAWACSQMRLDVFLRVIEDTPTSPPLARVFLREE